MARENRFVLSQSPCTLKSGEHTTLDFNTSELSATAENCVFRLRLRGDVQLHSSWMWEGGIPLLFRDIDDALSEETHHSRFSLKITANGEDYPRRAYYKKTCPLAITPQYNVPDNGDTAYKFSCLVKTQDLTVLPGGRAEICFERFLKQEGRDVRDIGGKPFETVTVKIPEGTQDWQSLCAALTINDTTAAVLVTIKAEAVKGTIWLEDPDLKNSTGFNILPPFDLSNQYFPYLNWTGENLSRKEWTELELVVNGTRLAKSELFQRCFSGSENEIEIPRGLIKDGENEIEIHHVSDYLHAVPYRISGFEVLWEELPSVRIISAPLTAAQNSDFAILLKTAQPNTTVSVSCGQGVTAPQMLECAEAGLHVLPMHAMDSGYRVEVQVCANGDTDSATIERLVRRGEDGVITGTGDAVYIPQEKAETERFLEWYFENHLGSMITFRPVYRWTGSRTLRPETWKRVAELCNAMRVGYCNMVDGRELPGINANPTNAMLAGEYFLGNQAHEQDGAYYYWRTGKQKCNDTLIKELSRRIFNHPDYLYRTPLVYQQDDAYRRYSQTAPADMREAAQQFVTLAHKGMEGIKRHTGPAVVFKYLHQAGIEVCGAELMYSSHEVTLAALRGAAVAYGKDRIAAHLAVQWCTTPHDTPERYRRYRLALFVSYINGVHHINTEEGLYRMEEYFAVLDRFSPACEGHAAVQRDFAQFCATHTRRGSANRSIAVISGANDGWTCFSRGDTWGQSGEEWKFDTPEESWDLLRVFYPDAVLDSIYRHPCPNAPQGYFSRTPYGLVDILPVEAKAETMCGYMAMAFLGWNTADEQQLLKLKSYVQNGGTLVLGWPHLFADTKREDAIRGVPHPLDASALTGVRLNRFLDRDEDGVTLGDIRLCEGAKVVEHKGKKPLVVHNKIGAGQVLFVNLREYPATAGARRVYERLLKLLAVISMTDNVAKGMITTADTVETATYDREDGHRVIYAINTDWWSAQKEFAGAKMIIEGNSYDLSIKRDVINIYTIMGDIAVATADNSTEVLSIELNESGFVVRVQGDGEATLTVCAPTGISCPDGEVEQIDGRFKVQVYLAGEKEICFCY